MRMGASIRLLSLWTALALSPQAAQAASCTVVNSGIYFGAYDSLSDQPRDSNASLQSTCQGSAGENVSFAVGVSELSGSGSSLSLSSGHGYLQYNLYLDAGRTLTWGDGTNGTSTIQDSVTIVSGTASKSFTVYGRIHGGQYNALPGTYAGQLVMTVNY